MERTRSRGKTLARVTAPVDKADNELIRCQVTGEQRENTDHDVVMSMNSVQPLLPIQLARSLQSGGEGVIVGTIQPIVVGI